MTKKVTEYQLVDHGVDGSQYFPGCGVAFTSFEHVATGCGDTFKEALDDCLESIAQDDVDAEALEALLIADGFDVNDESRSAIAECRKANGHLSDEEFEDDSQDWDVYYYVSIRYNVDTYEVIVGNVGTVYSGPNKADAETNYDHYVKQSMFGAGRAGNEPVTLMHNGDIVSEFEV